MSSDAVRAARAELAATLEAIEDKLNVPKQTRLALERAKRSYRENPVPWIIGAAAAVVVVGGAVALAVSRR